MDTGSQTTRRWRVFRWCAGGCVCAALAAQAALVDLDAYVTYSIFNHSSSPLADGSVVYIIGSLNNTVDPMLGYGPTSLVANSTTGDDVVLGHTTIDSTSTGSNGTFQTVLKYDSTQVNYVYIRFFEFANPIPVTGMVYWGNSAIHLLSPTPTLGVNAVDFNPGSTLGATNLNHFVSIPEPTTANLLILVAGMGWAMRARRKKGQARHGLGRGGAKP